MERSPVCPDAKELERFSLGQMTGPDLMGVERHLAACSRCVAVLHTMPEEDMLVTALRAQGNVPDLGQDPRVVAMIRRLEEMPLPYAPRHGKPDGPSDASAKDTQDTCAWLTPPETPDELGRLSNFRVLRLLGTGGMGVVFEAEDLTLRRRVALKVLPPGRASRPAARERFLREARAAAAIESEHVIHINQVGEERGVPFIVMPLLRGQGLDQRLEGRRLAPSEVVRIGREIGAGLAAAHDLGLVHRDIKPGNIWLEEPSGRVKLLDFGLVRDPAGPEGVGTLQGTPPYLAPEAARGEQVDHRADLFSLGCVLYRMCTGEAAFRGGEMATFLASLRADQPRTPTELNSEVPPALSELILSLLAKEPDKRPASAHEVIRTFEIIAREFSGSGPRADVVAVRATVAPKRWWPKVALLVGILCAATALIAALTWRLTQANVPSFP